MCYVLPDYFVDKMILAKILILLELLMVQLYQHKLIEMRAELANLNHCAVPFLSRAAVNLCWYYITYSFIVIKTETYTLGSVLAGSVRQKKSEIRFGSGSAKILGSVVSYSEYSDYCASITILEPEILGLGNHNINTGTSPLLKTNVN